VNGHDGAVPSTIDTPDGTGAWLPIRLTILTSSHD
jgi:hypothetical protein